MVVAVVCGLLVLPCWLVGDAVARSFRRLHAMAISRNDWLFDLTTKSDSATSLAHSTEAWGVWIVQGLTCGFIAMLLTRAITGRSGGAGIVAGVVGGWGLVRLALWNWDGLHKFGLTEFKLDGPPVVYGAWPGAPWLGFLAGLALGLAAAIALVRSLATKPVEAGMPT